MVEPENNREILSAALSAYVSELRLYWHDKGLSCRWLVPDSEHCYVDDAIIRQLRAFRDNAEATIQDDQLRSEWLDICAPLLDSEDISSEPFPLDMLTWLLSVAQTPQHGAPSTDAALGLWSVNLKDLPSGIVRKLSVYLPEQETSLVGVDLLAERFAQALVAGMPKDGQRQKDAERMTLNKRFDRLRRFRNLIFYGVANIGKANLSKQLISHWKAMTGREIGMHCVTVFHSKSCYEDMIERRIVGDSMTSRPSIDHCAPRVIAHHITDARYFFEPFTNDNIQEGLFLNLCRAAAYNPDKDFVFMIDCIDEARLEDVLGEVSHMLDSFARVPWRKGTHGGTGAWDLEAIGARSIRLSQSGRIFFVPGNVYILGTAIESGLFSGVVDDHLFQTFAVEYLTPMTAAELRTSMLSNRSPAAFARLEEYAEHSIDLWSRINDILIRVGGHANLIGYGPLFSMCEEILASSDVHDANRIVLGSWRYRMIPPIRVKMESLLHGDAAHRRALDELIECLNQSWLRMQIKIEGMEGTESLFMAFEPEFVI